ncbi:acyl-CoA carboxylase subunit epsilon [Cryobacterium sp. BB307]|uniref:acyl-CoA carboxylase epsilon subunit n=1 Tax=Cryobacterium sp. BB307 TaxID=2716317 RepID=UPI001446B122
MTDATEGPDIRLVRGNPTPEELAAVTAVLTAIAGELEGRQAPPVKRSPWENSQRPIRTPIVRGITSWRTFG